MSALPAATGASHGARLVVVAHVEPPGGQSADVSIHGHYAYLSSFGGGLCPAVGVRVYDLADPAKPALVSTLGSALTDPDLKGTWTEKTIVQHVSTPAFEGELAAVSIQACPGRPFNGTGYHGLALYDVTDPAHPKRLGLFQTPPLGAHELWLQPVGSHAYVFAAIPGAEARAGNKPASPPDLEIVDVTDPAKPALIGSWGAWSALGLRPDRGIGIAKGRIGHSVITDPTGTRAFLSYWDLGTVILDVHDPRHPQYLGRTTWVKGEEGSAHSAALADGGKVLVQTEEAPNTHPVLFDIRNPRKPKRIGELKPPRAVIASRAKLPFYIGVHNVVVDGTTVYDSWYALGVVVGDISDPHHPRFLAQFGPPPQIDRSGYVCPVQSCSAVWGVAAMPPYVLGSDMVTGLWILKLER